MIVAIDGMGGSEKTSISKVVASKLEFQYLEKAVISLISIGKLTQQEVIADTKSF